MKWLKRKLRNWINEPELVGMKDYDSSPVEASDIRKDPTLNFKIYSAVGGQVIEFDSYDHSKHTSSNTIYVIGKDEDLGQKVAKITNMEILKA